MSHAVIGAGTMGPAICQILAMSGFEVILLDVKSKNLAQALHKVSLNLERLVEKNHLTLIEKEKIYSRISTTSNFEDLCMRSFVIEAATENFEIKVDIFKRLEGVLPRDAIIATNTSSFSITKLASNLSSPQCLIGMHFFNPVSVMPLVEIVSSTHTSKCTLDTACDLATRLGKTSIFVQDSPGFIVNRMLLPMINDAFSILADGIASAENIDLGMKLGCNFPMGPLALADFIGLDICLAIMQNLEVSLQSTRYSPSPLLRKMVSDGNLGRKSGRGVYQYDAKL